MGNVSSLGGVRSEDRAFYEEKHNICLLSTDFDIMFGESGVRINSNTKVTMVGDKIHVNR